MSKQFWITRYTFWKATPENTELKEGEYSWTFSFELPKNLPATFHYEDFVFIFYQARAYVEPLKGVSESWNVISEPVLLEVLGIPFSQFHQETVKEPQQITKSLDKHVSIDVQIPQTTFSLGTSFILKLDVSHCFPKPLKLSITLYQSVAIDSPKYKKKFHETKLIRIEKIYQPTKEPVADELKILIPSYEEGQALGLTPSISKPYVGILFVSFINY